MRFLIVVPTVRQSRPGFDGAMARLRASFTKPTDLRILDGSEGKAQTLNAAFDGYLLASDAEIYVTLDDDLVPPPGWQDALVSAFSADPKRGALGLWLGEAHREYMGLGPTDCAIHAGEVSLIEAPAHLVGCLIAFRREVAMGVGKIPASDEKYQFWEDGWRGGRVRDLGFTLAYVVLPIGVPELIAYDDPPEYLSGKATDIASARKNLRKRLGGGFWARAFRRLRRGF